MTLKGSDLKPLDLLDSADKLLAGGKKPSQVNLRRATSSAYYALFHCLARACADLMVGGSGSDRSSRAWSQVYRSLEHGPAKNSCANQLTMVTFPAEIQDFANAFRTLQAKRHSADYDPNARFSKSAAQQDVALARQVISDFCDAPIKDRRAFCVWALLKPPRA